MVENNPWTIEGDSDTRTTRQSGAIQKSSTAVKATSFPCATTLCRYASPSWRGASILTEKEPENGPKQQQQQASYKEISRIWMLSDEACGQLQRRLILAMIDGIPKRLQSPFRYSCPPRHLPLAFALPLFPPPFFLPSPETQKNSKP